MKYDNNNDAFDDNGDGNDENNDEKNYNYDSENAGGYDWIMMCGLILILNDTIATERGICLRMVKIKIMCIVVPMMTIVMINGRRDRRELSLS